MSSSPAAAPPASARRARPPRPVFQTIVVEKGAAIGVPLRTSGGSWIDELAALGVPPRFYQPIHRIRVIGPHAEARFDFHAPRMCVIDVRPFYQWLAQRAADAGAEIRLETRVDATIGGDGRGVGVRTRERNGRVDEIAARVVVDATGYPSALARRAQLHTGFARSGSASSSTCMRRAMTRGKRFSSSAAPWRPAVTRGHSRTATGACVLASASAGLIRTPTRTRTSMRCARASPRSARCRERARSSIMSA
jgi:hypothetical protein